MPVEINIRIKNWKQFKRAFEAGSKELREEISRAIKFSIFKIEERAKPITPYDTGALRSRWIREISNFRATLMPYVYYAVYVHEGTRKWPLSMPARHGMERQFLLRGTERALPSIEQFFNQSIDSALDKIAKRT